MDLGSFIGVKEVEKKKASVSTIEKLSAQLIWQLGVNWTDHCTVLWRLNLGAGQAKEQAKLKTKHDEKSRIKSHTKDLG